MDGQGYPESKNAAEYGATHTAELPFTLANMDSQPRTNGSCNATDSEHDISRYLASSWTHMATDGDPGSSEWRRFSNKDPSGLVVQNGRSFKSLDFSECVFWDDLWAQMGGVNFSTDAYANRQPLTLDKSCRPNSGISNSVHWGVLLGVLLFFI